MISDARLLRALRSVARAHREILALYLFGSRAIGTSGPLSDLDLAVLLDEDRVAPAQWFDHRLELITAFTSACRRSDVDVVILNEAAPLLAYEVVNSGRLLCERDHQRRIAFEARAFQRYFDLAPFFAVTRQYLKRRLLSGTYGG